MCILPSHSVQIVNLSHNLIFVGSQHNLGGTLWASHPLQNSGVGWARILTNTSILSGHLAHILPSIILRVRIACKLQSAPPAEFCSGSLQNCFPKLRDDLSCYVSEGSHVPNRAVVLFPCPFSVRPVDGSHLLQSAFCHGNLHSAETSRRRRSAGLPAWRPPSCLRWTSSSR